MRVLERVALAHIQDHLRRQQTGVTVPIDPPLHAHEYSAYRAMLDERDVDRLILWFQARIHTKDETCRVIDALPSSVSHPRISRCFKGDASKGYAPLDLRHAKDREPVILTNDLESQILYLIDGNHRVIAQQIGKKGFQDVRVFVCVHPLILRWAYIPSNFKSKNL
jgi:hypothetical protein